MFELLSMIVMSFVTRHLSPVYDRANVKVTNRNCTAGIQVQCYYICTLALG